MKTEKTQHTPGPWTVRDADTHIQIRAEQELITVAEMSKDAIGSNEEAIAAAEADARLIAAAPDLLEACETAYKTLSEMTIEEFKRGADMPLRHLLLQAIAKAREPRLCDQPKSQLFEQLANLVRPEEK